MSLQLVIKMSNNLFQDEISACAAVHMRYVMDKCNHVQSIILLPPMMDVIRACHVNRLIVSAPKY